jgi:outer membrane protein assembly factor BamB
MKWAFDAGGDISATPAVAGGQVYVGDWSGMFQRLDAVTGSVVWSRSVADILGLSGDGGADGVTLDGALTDGPAGSEGVEDAGADGGADGSGLDAGTLPDAGDAAATDATVDTSVADATVGDAPPSGMPRTAGPRRRSAPRPASWSGGPPS